MKGEPTAEDCGVVGLDGEDVFPSLEEQFVRREVDQFRVAARVDGGGGVERNRLAKPRRATSVPLR